MAWCVVVEPRTLRECRIALGQSQAAFAAMLDVSPESYRTWDTGRRATPSQVMARAQALATHRDDHALLPLPLVANVCATHATGTAEREAAALLLEASAPPGSTVGADKGYDVASFVADVRIRDVTPHVAQKVRWSAIDGRTTRHAGYHSSQRKRKLVAQVFGWMKTVGGVRKLRHRGVALVDWQLTFAAAAYNLVRLRNLEATCP